MTKRIPMGLDSFPVVYSIDSELDATPEGGSAFKNWIEGRKKEMLLLSYTYYCNTMQYFYFTITILLYYCTITNILLFETI